MKRIELIKRMRILIDDLNTVLFFLDEDTGIPSETTVGRELIVSGIILTQMDELLTKIRKEYGRETVREFLEWQYDERCELAERKTNRKKGDWNDEEE